MFTIYPIHVTSSDFLGLVSKFPPLYWIGLALVALSGILASLGGSELNDKWIFYIAIIFALYLFATPILGEVNPRNPWSYYPSSETLYILKEGKVDPASPRTLISYHYLPGFHFLSGALLLVTDLNLEVILKYAPLYIVGCFLISVFFVGKQLRLAPSHSLLLIFTFLSAFWVPWTYYCPFAFSLILFTFAFGLLMSSKLSWQRSILISLISIGIILFHTLTSIVFLISLVTVAFSKRDRKLMLTSLTVSICLFSWYLYLSPLAFEFGLTTFLRDILTFDIGSYYGQTTKFIGGGIQQQIVNLFRLSSGIILASIFLFSFISFITRHVKNGKKTDPREKIVMWLIGSMVFIFMRYGVEMFERVYTLLLIPTLAFIFLTVENKKTIIALLLILTFLHIPAHYGSESFDMVFTADLNGIKFIARNISADKSILYQFWQYVSFYDLGNYRQFNLFQIWKTPEYRIIEISEYIVISEQSKNLYYYYFNFNPLKSLENSTRHNVIFNNGQFQLIARMN